MKRFLKNNLTFLLTLGIAGVVAIVLLLLVLLANIDMFSAQRRASTMRDDIRKLVEQQPAAVSDNLPRLENDITFYRQQQNALKNRFGNIFEPALADFYRELGTTEAEFQAKFVESWRKTPKGSIGRYTFTSSVIRDWPNWNRAKVAFVAKAQSCTPETINNLNEEEILFNALGLPRNMSGNVDSCVKYMQDMRQVCINLLSAGDVGFANIDFSFPGTTPPAAGDIVNVARHYMVIADIVKCISDSKVKSLDKFSKRSLAPREDNKYRYYHYEFAVTGDLANIRNLVSLLNNAVERNRFYHVQSVFLYSSEDQAERVFDDEDAITSLLRNQGGFSPANTPGKPGANPEAERLEQLRKYLEEEEKEKGKPYYDRSTYGRIVIGGQKSFRAVFSVEYVERIDGELKE